jgi:hypothetical protein
MSVLIAEVESRGRPIFYVRVELVSLCSLLQLVYICLLKNQQQRKL